MSAYRVFNDHQLSALLKKGDCKAFTEIYERYHSLLYIYAHKKLKNRQEAQDIIQEVLTSLWNNRTDFSLHVSLQSYLYTAVRNRALDLFSHRSVEEKYLNSLQAFINNSATHTDYLIRENDLKLLIQKEIQALPPRMREAFQLSRGSHLTHKEIAVVMNISEHTVSTQIKKAVRVLRMRLGLVAWIYMHLTDI